MAMDFEVHGDFWLPGEEGQKVAGILTFDRQGGGNLTLIGSLGSPGESVYESPRDYRRILGNDGKELYTLDDCLRTNSTVTYPSGTGRQWFQVGRIIKGVYAFEQGEEVTVDGLVVRMAHLVDWVRIDGLNVTDTFNEGEPPRKDWEIVGESQPSLACTTDCGTLKLGHQLTRTSRSVHGLSIEQDNYARFDFTAELALDDAIDYASDLQDLVTIVFGHPAAFETVHLFHPAFAHERPDGTFMRLPAELFIEWIAQPKPLRAGKTLASHDMLFTFKQFDGIDGVERWMAQALKYRSMLGRVMITIYTPFMYVQDRVLHRVAALEAFHKLWSGKANDVKLVDRLKELADYAGKPFATLLGQSSQKDNVTAWCQKAKDVRHDVAHHLGRPQHQDGAELFYVAQAAYWLFVICLLREAHAPQAVFDHMVSCPSFRFEAGAIQGIL